MQKRILIVLATFAMYFLWGGIYLACDFMLESFPPLLGNGTRLFAAALLQWPLLLWLKEPRPSWRQAGNAALIGIMMFSCAAGLTSMAQTQVSSGLASVVMASVPLWAILIAGIGKRWPNRMEWVAVGVGFAGIVLLNLDENMRGNLWGMTLLTIGSIAWALGSFWSERLELPGGVTEIAIEMASSGVILVAISLLSGDRWPAVVTPRAWAGWVFLMLGSLTAYAAYVYLIRQVGLSFAASYAYVNPIVAVFLGAVIAHEPVTPIMLLATTVVASSVVLLSLGQRRKKSGPAEVSLSQ